MRIVDAHWELRNLGVTTQEVEIESSDKPEEIRKAILSLTSDYQVVKAPSTNFEFYSLLSECGFSFVEAMIKVSYSLKTLSCPPLIKRFSNEITYNEMDDSEIGLMQEQIKAGIFKTDRVALDLRFSSAQAANRYIMWMNDELTRGSKLFTYKYKGQPVGFSCIKETSPDVYYPVLGGVYNSGKALPFGSVILYKQLEIARDLRGKDLYTYISSNNPAVVRIYSTLGYVFEDCNYVFIKHMK